MRPARAPEPKVVAVLRTTVAVGASLAVSGSTSLFLVGEFGAWWVEGGAVFLLMSLFFGFFVWSVIPRQPRNAVVRIMAAPPFFGGLFLSGWAAAAFVVEDPGLVSSTLLDGVPAQLGSPAAWILVFTAPAWVGAVFPPITLGLLLFPDGRAPSPRWRWVGILACAGMLLSMPAWAWGHRPGSSVPADQVLLLGIGLVASTLAVLLSLLALAVRFRRSTGTTRQQIKWVVWGASVFVLAVMLAFFPIDPQNDNLIAIPLLVGSGILLASYGIAVGRYRLYDVDLVISRTLVYAVVVGVLGMVYAGGVVLLRGLFPWEGDLAVAASTLVVAGLFNPLRHRVQRGVDRRFYRSRYDAQEVVEEFSGRLRDQVDLDALTEKLVEVVARTMHPEGAEVWLRPRDS